MKLAKSGRLLKDIVGMAREHKSWWIVPLILALLIGGLLIASGQVAAPMIYTLF